MTARLQRQVHEFVGRSELCALTNTGGCVSIELWGAKQLISCSSRFLVTDSCLICHTIQKLDPGLVLRYPSCVCFGFQPAASWLNYLKNYQMDWHVICIHGPQRMKHTVADPLTFSRAPPRVWHLWFWVKCLNNVELDGLTWNFVHTF